MKVIYLMQTYKNPAQIKRLINTIKRLSNSSQVLISHDSNAKPLNDEEFTCIPGVHVIYNPGGRGDFRNVQVYLNSLKWLFDNQIEFDWIVNLSVNDYPTQPLWLFEKFLSETEYDGFVEHRDVLSANGYLGGLQESRTRYFYQYWHSGLYLNQWQKFLIKPIRMLVNNSQPFVKIADTYQLSLGVRASRNVFDANFKCYGGSMHQIISNKCAKYLQETASQREDLVEYYKKTVVPDESFIPTLLGNSQFNLCDKNCFYINWNNTKHGHPKILTKADYSSIVARKDIYFARKFDPSIDSEVLDMLDRHLSENQKVQNKVN